MAEHAGQTHDLMSRARQGDRQALGDLFALHRDRLRLMVHLRLDHRLQGRIDPSDVLQEAYLEALERFDAYAAESPMPFFVWLRFLTAQRLVTLHRQHLDVQARAAGREVSFDPGGTPEASSELLAAQLVGRHSTPSQAAARAEMQRQLQGALDRMDTLDREVLVLRHFEQLTNGEVAETLGLKESAASRRYSRALWRLKEVLTEALGDPGSAP
jgi:RNA polymerase sigma-70 factor (ECF subfamily)